jgi:hypothetical protein
VETEGVDCRLGFSQTISSGVMQPEPVPSQVKKCRGKNQKAIADRRKQAIAFTMFFTDLSPMIPRQPRHSKPLAPDQIFSAGFRDGMNHRPPHPQFQDTLHYLKGYAEGCRSVADRPTFVAFCRSASLDTALQSFHLWEKDRERLGFGSVAISFCTGWWIVLVSQDLHDAALPF